MSTEASHAAGQHFQSREQSCYFQLLSLGYTQKYSGLCKLPTGFICGSCLAAIELKGKNWDHPGTLSSVLQSALAGTNHVQSYATLTATPLTL